MQKACLRLVYNRKAGGDIARTLNISKSTVESHLAQARRTLGVSRSVEAAEMLHAFEAQADPCNPSTYPTPLYPEPDIRPTPAEPDMPSSWRATIPLRRTGSRENDLSILQRLGWIVAIAIAIALGVGAVANAVRFIDEVVRSR